MLERAGFRRIRLAMSPGYEGQLPLYLGERSQNEAAVHAASMLAAAGYGVDLDPGLGSPPPTAGYVPAPVPDPVAALTALAERFGTDTGYEEAAVLLEQLAGANGVLDSLAALTRAAAAWCEDRRHVPGDELADRLLEAVRDTEALAGRLRNTGPQVAALGRSWTAHEPSPRRAAGDRPLHTTTSVVSGELSISFGALPDQPTVVAIGASRDGSLAARLLEKAGFRRLPDLGIHELPADTHPLDAMLRVEDAADRLAAAGFTDLGIDPALTELLVDQAQALTDPGSEHSADRAGAARAPAPPPAAGRPAPAAGNSAPPPTPSPRRR
ncbi:hypothetical protein ACFVUH_08575 [Kitasatospora sp. NPDC058032]|uniref:hypothetical protein n=1 Tax=Kitasatospora sp. NPDC058032 TaxID=3346307 RepID=UPI0036DCD6F0